MSKSDPIIVWFREDLRLADNPALNAATASGQPVLCLFVLEDGPDCGRRHGGASRWWLHESLMALGGEIKARGGQLVLRRGDPGQILPSLASEVGAQGVFWNRRYTSAGIAIDTVLKSRLKEDGRRVETFNGRLLTEPWEIRTGSGGHYRVFTPYWKAMRSTYRAPPALPAPERLAPCDVTSERLDDWALRPVSPNWAAAFPDHWCPGEQGAQDRLATWLDGAINGYSERRNLPALKRGTSGLSPHLRWGEIGPAQVWRSVMRAIEEGRSDEDSGMVFLSEIVWREFSYVLLYHQPDLASENYNPAFGNMPWRDSDQDYSRWCRGLTGYPIVDAGMRQLWATGWMHNRVRMIVGSFLTKHLLLPWQKGEDWFWDTLLDADPASNAASWQWVAGSGADAAPYFRVFNPITQAEKFDPDGEYIRRWCPELARLATKDLFAPWEAPVERLARAGIELGKTYPRPIINHKDGRQRALDAYETLKERREAS